MPEAARRGCTTWPHRMWLFIAQVPGAVAQVLRRCLTCRRCAAIIETADIAIL